MIFRWLATLVVVGHALFVAFVLFGGFLVLRWPRVAWVHIPCAVWGVLIEYENWICPLTPLEDSLRFPFPTRAPGAIGRCSWLLQPSL